MKTVSLPTNSQFYSLNTLTGYSVSLDLVVTNASSSPVFLVQSATQPIFLAPDTYPLLPGKSIMLASGKVALWALGDKGPVVVQDTNSLICPSEMMSPRIMIGLEALTVQTFGEANCKNGTQFELTTYDPAFTAAGIRDFIITTGAKPVLVKNRKFSFTGSELTTTIYKNPTYTGGTVLPYYNLSDINPMVGLSTIKGLPTVTNVGTQFSPTFTILGEVPQGGQAVSKSDAEQGVPGLERVLAPNSSYLYRTVNTGTLCKFTSINTWYEGDLSSTAF